MNIERRFTPWNGEVRADSDSPVIAGHAAVFNKLSQNLGGFVEQVAPGAFAKTLQEADVRALFNHEPNLVLGRNKSGTLRMAEDNIGLFYELDVPDTTVGRDLVYLMRRGDISQSSFAFRVIEDEWGLTEQEFPLRTLREVALYDVSPVTYPAYLDADSGLKNALRSLATRTARPIEEVCEIATSGELRSLIAPVEPGPVAPTPDSERRRKRLDLLNRA